MRGRTALQGGLIAIVLAAAVVVAGCGGGKRKTSTVGALATPNPSAQSPAASRRFFRRLGTVRTGTTGGRARSLLGRPDRTASEEIAGRTIECWHYPYGASSRGTQVCLADGRTVNLSKLLVVGRTDDEVRFLLGAPDSISLQTSHGETATCWDYNLTVGARTVCIRDGKVISAETG